MQHNLRENKMGTMPIGKLLANMAVPMILSMLVQAKNKEVVIPEGIKVIGAHAFRETGITKVIIPSSVERIEQSAFENTNESEINLPKGIRAIGDSAFSHCECLLKVTFQNCL